MTRFDSMALLEPASPADRAMWADRALNAAILNADISVSYEEFLAIVDQFYADHVEVGTDTSSERLIGKTRLKTALLGFLVPLHIMAEIGGLFVSIRQTPIATDSTDQHSQWSLELVGVTGRRVRTIWSVRRRWQDSQVIDEYHYDHRQEGEPLSSSDLRIAAANGLE